MAKIRHLITAAAFALSLSAVPAHAAWWDFGKDKPKPGSSSTSSGSTGSGGSTSGGISSTGGWSSSGGTGSTGSTGGGMASSGGTPIPEPGNLGLFMAGVVGLMLGRRSSRARRRRED